MAKEADSEKITINLGFVDLGQIDLLVEDGFYSNRTDFIRTAIRNQVSAHAEVVKQTVARRTLVLGLQHFSKADLEAGLFFMSFGTLTAVLSQQYRLGTIAQMGPGMFPMMLGVILAVLGGEGDAGTRPARGSSGLERAGARTRRR